MAIFDNKYPWFAVPNHLIFNPTAKNEPGPWSTFSVGEARLYPVLYALCNRKKSHAANITNTDLRTFTGLNRTSLPKAIKSLQTQKLIKATQADKSRKIYRYEILDQDGKPMTGESLQPKPPTATRSSKNGFSGKTSWHTPQLVGELDEVTEETF